MRYTDIIINATSCTPEEADQIEEIMRNDIFHSTLDWQTKKQLENAAIQGKKLLDQYKAMGIL